MIVTNFGRAQTLPGQTDEQRIAREPPSVLYFAELPILGDRVNSNVRRFNADHSMMTADKTSHEAWNADPLAAGVAIYSSVPNDRRPEWAANILAACCHRVAKVPNPVQYVIDLASDPQKWKFAHDAFSGVRQLTLTAERRPIGKLDHYLLYLAENTAKVIYNASGLSAPFDRDSGAWLVRCAKEFADCENDPSFTSSLWSLIVDCPSGSNR